MDSFIGFLFWKFGRERIKIIGIKVLTLVMENEGVIFINIKLGNFYILFNRHMISFQGKMYWFLVNELYTVSKYWFYVVWKRIKEAIKVVVIKHDDKFNNLINRVMEVNGVNKNRLLLFHEILTLHVIILKGKLFCFFHQWTIMKNIILLKISILLS